jgi:hypothetical protein
MVWESGKWKVESGKWKVENEVLFGKNRPNYLSHLLLQIFFSLSFFSTFFWYLSGGSPEAFSFLVSAFSFHFKYSVSILILFSIFFVILVKF